MARPRDPRRDQAFKLWKNSGGTKKLKDIAAELDVSSSQVRKWKNLDQWEEKLNGNVTKLSDSSNGNVTKPGAPKGTKNARGNKGGKAPPGNTNAIGNSGGAAPPGNKNARTTGEYESILFDELDEEEKDLFHVIDSSPWAQIDENIRMLTLRERRMLQRIKEATKGLNQVQTRILKERVKERQTVQQKEEQRWSDSSKRKMIQVDMYKMVPIEEETTSFRKIDDILKIEDALTRIQSQKLKAIRTKHDIIAVFEHKKYMDVEKLAIERGKIKTDEEINEALQIVIKRKEKRTGEPDD